MALISVSKYGGGPCNPSIQGHFLKWPFYWSVWYAFCVIISYNNGNGERYYVAGMDDRSLRCLVDNRFIYH
jgi:hypothetical protein